MDHRLVGVPGIEGSISGDVSRKELKRGDGTDVERSEVRDISFVEGLGIFSKHDIAVDRIGTGGNA